MHHLINAVFVQTFIRQNLTGHIGSHFRMACFTPVTILLCSSNIMQQSSQSNNFLIGPFLVTQMNRKPVYPLGMIPPVTAPGALEMIPGNVAHPVYKVHSLGFFCRLIWFNAQSRDKMIK
jgi:hypothetical protein